MSALDDAIARFRRRLAAREADTVRTMVAAYHGVEREIREELIALLFDLEELPLSARPAALRHRGRLAALERDIISELERITGRTYEQILREQGHSGRAAAADFIELLDVALGDRGAPVVWTRLNADAVAHVVAALQDASPLRDLIDELSPWSAKRVREELIRGVALGKNPRETAARVRGALGGSLTRAMTISRTETLRAYRAVTAEGYRRNANVVKGWVWVSALDARTCPVCIALHGTFHSLDETMATHPNCRCSMAPATRTWEELGITGIPDTAPTIELGTDWFDRQDVATRRRILGPSKFAAHERGLFRLGDLVGTRTSRAWGPSVFERSLVSLVGPREAARFVSGSRSVPSKAATSAARATRKRTTAPKTASGSPPRPPRRPAAPTPSPDDDPLRGVGPGVAQSRKLNDPKRARTARWYLEKRAAEQGISPEAMIERMESDLRRLLADVRVNRRQRPEALLDILRDGRFKSQFETFTSGGAMNPSYRATKELGLFGYRRSLVPEQRPIYGYLTNGLEDDRGYYVGGYGRTRVVFREDVHSRTTFILADSLNAMPAQAPSPIGAPRWYSHQLHLEDLLELERISDAVPYAEAQLHRGVTVADIEQVFLAPQIPASFPELIAELNRLGIPWSVDDRMV